MFKDLTIDWTQIKTFGVCVTGSDVKRVIDKKDYYRFVLVGQIYIFIADKEKKKCTPENVEFYPIPINVSFKFSIFWS